MTSAIQFLVIGLISGVAAGFFGIGGGVLVVPLLIYWSVRNLENDLPSAPSVGDKLFHFAYAITHVFQITRWDRTFRPVK